MKTTLLSAAAATILLVTTSAAQEDRRRINASVGEQGVAENSPRFDLHFAGGSVKEFVAAVSKAQGKTVNVIIPKESEGVMIPAVDVSRVTVASLFIALGKASQHDVLVSRRVVLDASGNQKESSDVRIASFEFTTEDSSPFLDAVWAFRSTNSVAIPMNKPIAPPRVVQYYPVAEYLTHFTVEDITAAIESGWQLQGGDVQPPATIRFHEETKLLICVGTAAQIELIPQVLKGLSAMLRYPRTENLPITRRASQIIIPKLAFQDASVTEAVDYVRRKAAELDPQHQGFNIVVRLGEGAPERKITLALSEVPALEVLKYIADLSGLEIETRDHAIVLSGRQSPVGAAPRMSPPTPFVPVPVPNPPPAIPASPAK